ncbi:hypothetical protein LTR95_012559 [Oleoguttula sp. CCFEE 5521]
MYSITLLSSICIAVASALTIIPAHGAGNATWPYQKYQTANYTPPWLKFDGRAPANGKHLFIAPDGATAFQAAPTILDLTNGELIWSGPKGHAFAFGVQEYDGQDVLVYWNGTAFPEPVGRGNGAVHILDNHYEEIAVVTLAGNFLELTPGASYESNIDLHEIYITADGTLLVTANNVTQTDLTSVGGPEDGWIVDCQIYEIDIATNEVLFSWSSLDHLADLPLTASFYPLKSEGYDGSVQSKAWGYFHINSVAPFQAGYIISSRYLCSAIAIGADGCVKWRIQGRDGGDFTLGNGTNFCYQHDIRILPVRPRENESFVLHMHDNSNCPIDNGTIASSGLVLNVHPATRSVKLSHRLWDPSKPIYANAQGNFEPMLEGSFAGHGWIPVAEEFSSSGRRLSTIQYGAAVARPGGGYSSGERGTLSYRASKQAWIGRPLTAPDIVARSDSNGTTVWVSWNGATEVVGWEIYGGPAMTNLTLLSAVSKRGFETRVRVPRVTYVQVTALLKPWIEDPSTDACGYGDDAGTDVIRVLDNA